MAGYALGYAGAAGGEFAERQMADAMKRRMWEAEMAAQAQEQQRIQQAEAVRAQQAARGLELESERNVESRRQFDVGQQADVAERQAKQAAADAEARQWFENLSQIADPAQQRYAEARRAGIEGTDIHAYETPEKHEAHLAAEEARRLAGIENVAHIQGRVGARTALPDKGPAPMTPEARGQMIINAKAKARDDATKIYNAQKSKYTGKMIGPDGKEITLATLTKEIENEYLADLGIPPKAAASKPAPSPAATIKAKPAGPADPLGIR